MEKIRVMVVGFPHNAAFSFVKRVEKTEGMRLVPFTLSKESGELKVSRTKIWQIEPQWHQSRLGEIAPDVVVDFVKAENIQRNTGLYCQSLIPFVFVITSFVMVSDTYWRNSSMVRGVGIPAVIVPFSDCQIGLQDTVIKAVQFLVKYRKTKQGIFTIKDVLNDQTIGIRR